MDEEVILFLLQDIQSHERDSAFLERHILDLLQAVRWAAQRGLWSLVHEYAVSLTHFFVLHTPNAQDCERPEVAIDRISQHWRRGYEILNYGLEASGMEGNLEAAKEYLWHLATLAANLGQFDRDQFDTVQDHALEYLSLANSPEERWMIAYNATRWAREAARQENYAASQALLRMALGVLEEQNDEHAVASCYFFLGQSFEGQGEMHEAKSHFGQALRISRRIGWTSLIATSLLALAKIADAQGDIALARRLCEEGLHLVQEQDDPVTGKLHALQTELDQRGL